MEAVIALAVLAVGILLAGSLLVQAQRMIAQAGVAARGPVSELGVARLRAELQGAAGIDPGPAPLPGWSRDRLDLVYPDGRRVRWEKRGSSLVRRVLVVGSRAAGSEEAPEAGRRSAPGAGSGGPGRSGTEGQVILRNVASWRWLRQGPRLVAVELVTLESGKRAAVLDPGGGVAPDRRAVPRRFTVALRGGGLGWGW